MKLEEIAENHGLTPEGVDYALTQYQTVICEITRGMMSKLSYDAKDILYMAQKRWCGICNLNKSIKTTIGQKKIDFCSEIVDMYLCGNCKYELDYNWKYCPICGGKVKWN